MDLYNLFKRLKGKPTGSIHQFKAKSIEGKEIDFKNFAGKKLLIVNTASECGFTSQFKDLEELHQKYKNTNLQIIGFPCNDFGHQDPGSNSEIQTFCERNFGVSFLMMEKISVKGSAAHPLYHWLTHKDKNGVMNSHVNWNFQKYLVDENGFLVDMVLPVQSPHCKKIVSWIEKK